MKLSRRWWVSTATYIAALIVLAACSTIIKPDPPKADPHTVSDPLAGATTDGKAVKDGVHAASINVGTGAGQIVADGKTGMVQTQPNGPKADNDLYTLFGRIVTNGLGLVDQGSKLAALETKVDSLNSKVEAGATAFQQYKTQTDAALADKDAKIAAGAKQHEADQKEIASLKSTFTNWVHLLMLGVTLLFAANIAICFWIQDFKIAVVVGIGCVVAMVSLVVMNRVYQITDAHADGIIYTLGGIVAFCILYFIIEVLCRGSVSAALKSTPIKDVEDVIERFKSTPVPTTK